MKTYINHINGKDYLYAYDRIYIAHGKSIQKSKSLGNVKSITNLADKQNEFSEFILKEEIKKRTAHWTGKIGDPDFTKYCHIEELESLRASLYRAKQEMGDVATGAMENAFMVDFIYNSNRLEGSKIPRKQVAEVVKKQRMRKKGEVENTIAALREVDENFKFDIKRTIELHNVLMAHESKNLGLREGPVVVGNSEVADWQEIKDRLKGLFEWYKQNRRTMYPPELAFDFYYKFERIHPFIDGNGRVGRLIMNRILKENRYHPIIISWTRKEAQENAFVKRMEGRPQTFYKFLGQEFKKTHEIYLDKIEKAFSFERLAESFMTPSEYYEG